MAQVAFFKNVDLNITFGRDFDGLDMDLACIPIKHDICHIMRGLKRIKAVWPFLDPIPKRDIGFRVGPKKLIPAVKPNLKARRTCRIQHFRQMRKKGAMRTLQEQKGAILVSPIVHSSYLPHNSITE